MSLESSISFLIIIYIFAITPGPGVFALLARSLASGIRPCIGMSLGMAISDIIYFILACVGLAAIATQWTEVFTVIRFVGASYLIYLGWKMWTSPVEDSFTHNTDKSAFSFLKGFTQGFLISVSNPKVIFFYIAFLPTILDLNSLTTLDIILGSTLTLVGLMLGLMTIVVFASSARNFVKSQKAVKRLNKTSGGIMFGAGSFLAIHG